MISARRSALLGAVFAVLTAAGCARRVDTVPVSVVFFENNSVALDGAARGVLREFAADAATAPQAPIVVRGYADPTAAPGAISRLSAERAQAVTDALVRQGIAISRITQRPRGASNLDPGLESRRVEIQLVR